jgi:hypothetical protein
MKRLLGLLALSFLGCSHVEVKTMDRIVFSEQYRYCYTTEGVKVLADTACPDPRDVTRDIHFVLDYAHAPDSSVKGLDLIFEPADIACAGVLAEGCSDPFLMTSVVIDYLPEKIRSITRHELYHIVLWRTNQNSDDVMRDGHDVPMRKDWADIERGPS